MAFSGVPSLILHGGWTAHSCLKIPVASLSAESVRLASKRLVALLSHVRLIVWDDTTTASKFHIDCVDPTTVDQPFGDRVIVFIDDCREVLPVIRHCKRSQYHKLDCREVESLAAGASVVPDSMRMCRA